MEIIGTISTILFIIFCFSVSIFLVRKYLPYKLFLMKAKNQGCYNCKWAKENTYSIFQHCNCPIEANKDSVSGKYDSLSEYTIGTYACKWEEK